MTLALLFVLVVLGAYRLWRFLALDDLPPLVWVRDGFEGFIDRHFGPEWSSGVSCPWCSGWWASCIAVGVVWHFRPLPLPLLWMAAVSALVGLVAMLVEH